MSWKSVIGASMTGVGPDKSFCVASSYARTSSLRLSSERFDKRNIDQTYRATTHHSIGEQLRIALFFTVPFVLDVFATPVRKQSSDHLEVRPELVDGLCEGLSSVPEQEDRQRTS